MKNLLKTYADEVNKHPHSWTRKDMCEMMVRIMDRTHKRWPRQWFIGLCKIQIQIAA